MKKEIKITESFLLFFMIIGFFAISFKRDNIAKSAIPIDKSETSYMLLTTIKEVGKPILLYINAEENYKYDLWIDLNGDGHKNTMENIYMFDFDKGEYFPYYIDSETIALYGKVTHFVCNNNQLTYLDVRKNKDLIILSCAKNKISSLDLSRNRYLTELFCYKNKLVALKINKNKALLELHCYENQLTSLDVSKNTSLLDILCNDNQLTSLDVSKNIFLIILDCSNNQLTYLNVGNNSDLKNLNCNYNQLTSLDISKSNKLNNLYCANNKLTSLDVSNNDALTFLDCSNNQLSSLDIGKNNVLKSLFIQGNNITDETKMLSIVDNIPDYKYSLTKGEFKVVKSQSSKENKITKAQVNALKDKGWAVVDFEGNHYAGE